MNIAKLICTTACLCLLTSAVQSEKNPTPPIKSKSSYPKVDRHLILKHVGEMSANLDIKVNPLVEKKIKQMTKKGRHSTETLLGRSITYFPIFETYLKAYGLPQELKYLPVIESSLDLSAKSKAGAAGLWQFTRSTGRAYGMTIDGNIDERLDLHKSSDAAARLLSDLYKMFKDWPLALAAYNCGPTRVRKAINQRRSKNFWRIKSVLPKETQDYVVKFMATAYVMSYYQFYDLRPAYPDYDRQFVKTIKVYGANTLTNLSRESGISVQILKHLNPVYKKGIVPANPYGNFVVLPKLGIRTDFRKPENQPVSALSY